MRRAMPRIAMTALLAALVSASGLSSAIAAEKKDSPIGKKVADFALQDFRGEEHRLSDFDSSKGLVVAVLGVECPLAKLYGPKLQKLADDYAEKGIQFLAIFPNRQDSITELAHYARVHGVQFPVMKDVGNKVVDQLGAQRTPEVFLLDENRKIRYWGRVDDQYGLGSSTGYAKTQTRERHLANAIDQMLDGEEIAVPLTEAPGCIIGRIRDTNDKSSVTYGNQISRILQKNCVDCHREGQIAPFALTDYEEVVGWAEMIEEVVRQQRMPPWHADPKYGHFYNDRSMTAEEKDLIYTWVRNGAPLGDPSQLPEPVDYPEGWQLSEPDQVIAMSDQAYTVPAEGVVEYQYFYVDPGWTEDRWLASSEVLFGNRQVVHHVFVFAIPPEVELEPWEGPREGSDGVAGGSGGSRLIAGAAPGTPPFAYPLGGMASHMKAGTKLVFQMHYTPCGHEVADRTEVGFTFADPQSVKYNVATSMAINFSFRIPPDADNHPVKASKTFEKNSYLLTMAPHMHLRGKAFRYELEYPDGTIETLLNVPRYDFNWQMVYMLDEPKLAPAGSTLRCLAHFDNSEENLANPNPDEEVRWGDQTWEEMMIGWYTATEDVDPQDVDRKFWRTTRYVEEAREKKPRISGLIKRAAGKALESEAEMDKLFSRVTRIVPQVDRICVSTVDGNEVRLLAAAQTEVLIPQLGDATRVFSKDSALASYATAEEVVMNPRLGTSDDADLQAMSKMVGSSMHVPLVIDGKKISVSFWSREPEAFPAEASEVLTEIAKLMKP